uniref:Phospholipase-like protein n=1 Tax=Tanacetum cinerariifolium TaxID=118510 RepID=A0A6L2K9F9_TANCI|nr:phospholipase-like protein [Tanacetum cinerariifolium]
MLSRISFHVLYGRPFKTLCLFNYALMKRHDYDITYSLRRGVLQRLRKTLTHVLEISSCIYLDDRDLKHLFNRIDRFFLSHDLEEWLSRYVVGRCKFPWCNDISVDRSFWHGLCGLDDNRQGLHSNKPKRHWSLAMFHICSGIVTFYDSEKSNVTHDKEFRLWYLKMRQCLEEKFPMVLKENGVLKRKILIS